MGRARRASSPTHRTPVCAALGVGPAGGTVGRGGVGRGTAGGARSVLRPFRGDARHDAAHHKPGILTFPAAVVQRTRIVVCRGDVRAARREERPPAPAGPPCSPFLRPLRLLAAVPPVSTALIPARVTRVIAARRGRRPLARGPRGRPAHRGRAPRAADERGGRVRRPRGGVWVL